MFAVEVDNLRKEFFRRDATRTHLRKRRKRVAALEDVTFTMERGECVAILGQNGSGKSTLVRLLSTLLLPDGGQRDGSSATTSSRSRAPVQRLVNRVSVEASFFKKMSSEENLAYAARFYGMAPPRRDDEVDPADPRARRLPDRPPARGDGEPVARNAAEGRPRAGAADLTRAAAARRADDRARSALEARGAGVHP